MLQKHPLQGTKISKIVLTGCCFGDIIITTKTSAPKHKRIDFERDLLMYDIEYYKRIFDRYGGMMRTTQLAEEKVFYQQREKLIEDGYASGGKQRFLVICERVK